MPKVKATTAALSVCAFAFIAAVQPLGAQGVDGLLDEFNDRFDLTQKTIDENRGHVYYFSRERLDQMGARTLKDVFKTLPVIYYQENRYGLPDPLNSGYIEPYKSNFVRIFIDGVEVTQAWAGSGLLMYGDMDLGFVDHIECYLATPSFEKSIEPAYLTIFVYSKASEREESSLRLTYGTNGYAKSALQVIEGDSKQRSLLANIAITDNKRAKVENATPLPLSRDQRRTQLFVRYDHGGAVAHLQWLRHRGDGFAGMSLDATPLYSKADYDSLHLDVGVALGEYWRFQGSYDWFKSTFFYSDDAPLAPFGTVRLQSVDLGFKTDATTLELDYTRTLGRHIFHAGIKGRQKRLLGVEEAQLGTLNPAFDRESALTLYVQDQYMLKPGHLLSLGVEYSALVRNGEVEDDTLWQLRLGYVATSGKWSYKGYIYRAMFALDPLARFMILSKPSLTIDPQKTWAVTSEFAYKEESAFTRLMLLWMKDTNGLNNTFEPGKGNTTYRYAIVDHRFDFDIDTSLNATFYYARYDDIFDLNSLDDTSATLSLWKRWRWWDGYLEAVWHRNSVDDTDYIDLGGRISWQITPQHTLTLKGENLLDKAKASQLLRIDPLSGARLEPIDMPHIDRRVTIEWEYLF